MRYMLDTDTPLSTPLPGEFKIPRSARIVSVDLVAGYVNGYAARQWHSLASLAMDVSIDVLGSEINADVCDCESGDATPDKAAEWAYRKRMVFPRSYPPVIYCNRGNITAVFNACRAKGLEIVKDFRTFVATLDGTQRLPDMTGVTAIQVWGEKDLGFHADASIVYDDSWKAKRGTSMSKIKWPAGVRPVGCYTNSRGELFVVAVDAGGRLFEVKRVSTGNWGNVYPISG